MAYFGVPALAIFLLGARGRAVPPERERAAVAHEAVLFPRSAMARFARGQSALGQGDAVTGRSELDVALQLAPSFAGPARVLAALDDREGKPEAVIEHGRAAVEAEPKDGELRYLLATALARQKRLEEAEAQYREVVRLRPEFAGGYEGLGVIAKWEGRIADAIPLFRKAASLDPNLADAYRNLAGTLATAGQTSEALAVLGNYRTRHPEDRVAADLERAIRADAGVQPTHPQ
jgi:Tfp pilus assembly protein PilF